jgi:hypothetical protein
LRGDNRPREIPQRFIRKGREGRDADGRIYEVSEVNEHIKALLDEDAALAGIFVRGDCPIIKSILRDIIILR